MKKVGCEVILLEGLADADATALVRLHRPDMPAHAVRSIVREAQGKPLVLEQLAIGPELPKRLRLSADACTAVARRTAFRKLTSREREVLTLVGQGLTSKEIAQWLGVSPLTVNSEVQAGRDKLGAKTRAQAALLLSTLYSTHASDSNRWKWRPLILAQDAEVYAAERAALERAGWATVDGWGIPYSEWDVSRARIVCCGRVADEDGATAAAFAAARGAGLLLMLDAPPEIGERLLEDLRHLGYLERRRSPDTPLVPLDDEQRRLLELLAEGKSIVEAAEEMHLSRRTATRRLAAARAALGVSTTREALVRALGRPARRSVRARR